YPELGGRCSTLVATDRVELPAGDAVRDVQRTFAAATSWTERCAGGRTGRRAPRGAGRDAGVVGLTPPSHRFSEVGNDRKVLDEASRELVWICEGWGMDEDARLWERRRASEYDDQMSLFG